MYNLMHRVILFFFENLISNLYSIFFFYNLFKNQTEWKELDELILNPDQWPLPRFENSIDEKKMHGVDVSVSRSKIEKMKML